MPTIPNIALPTATPTSLGGGAAYVGPSNAAPYNAIVRVTLQAGPDGFQGSGVLISPGEVLTASHVDWTSKPGDGVATNIDVVPDYLLGGGAPYGHFAGTATHYHQVGTYDPVAGPNMPFSDTERDFAVIHLDNPVTGITPWTLGDGSFAGGSVFVSGYPGSAGGSRVDQAETVRQDPKFSGMLDGQSTGPGSSGGPVWQVGSTGLASVVGVISSQDGGGGGYFARLTTADVAEIKGWVAQDDAAPPPPAPAPIPTPSPAPTPLPAPPPAPVQVAAIFDTTTNTVVPDTFSHPYVGPVAGVQTELIDVSTHNLNITATAPSMFIHTGSGNDAVALKSGTNVVDGGTGSNFLTGGSGPDTFFVDARALSSDVWSTVNGLSSGDAATMWGISPSTSTLSWSDNGGAVGSTGLTLHATAAGKPTASLTLAGYNTGDLANGRLGAVFGHNSVNGSDYLYVHAT